jgi:aryl-alcohol dehydrogenase-like predicted oxidoreductase
MQALHDVVKAGYVRYIGMSSCWAWQCAYHCMYRKQVLTIAFIYVVHAMQSGFTGPLEGKDLTIETDYAINNNLTPFISMQNHYNLIYREEEREMFPTLKVDITSPISLRVHL